MGDHTHEKGEVMLSYRWMYMGMEGSRDGTDRIDNADIVSPTGYNFLVTPLRMPMQMHMLGAMYAPADRVTLMGMVNILSNTMDHQMRPGAMFTTESRGVGDTSLAAMVLLADGHRQRVHLNLGVSLPTGSITEQDLTPASAPNEARLPYPMQLGSGTYDFLPGITYLAESDNWSGGAQVRGTVRTGENDANYRLGNRLLATTWAARKLGSRFSASLRLASERWGDIKGGDANFAGPVMMRMVPTVFTDLRAGNRVDIGAGINTYLRRSRPGQIRLAVEVLRPVYQRLDGPQLESDYQVVFGTQFLF